MYSVSSGCVLTWLGLIHFLYAMMNDVDDDDVLLLLVLVLPRHNICQFQFYLIVEFLLSFDSCVICVYVQIVHVRLFVCLFVCLFAHIFFFYLQMHLYTTLLFALGLVSGSKFVSFHFAHCKTNPIVMIIIEGSKCKFFLPSSCSFALFFQLLLLFFPSIGLQFRFVAIFTPFYHCVCPFFLFSHE